MTRPFFTRDRISDCEIFEKHAEDAIERLKARLKQGYPVDFQVQYNYCLSVSLRLLTGGSRI